LIAMPMDRRGIEFARRLMWRKVFNSRAVMMPPKHLATGATHAGHFHAGARSGLLRPDGRLRLRLRTALRRTTMMFDYTLAGLVSAGLLFYLTYALLRPERF
jgi:K+-transporting ATPase KdpF subunit